MTTPSQYKLLPYEPTDQMIRRLPDWEQAVKDYKYMWENGPRFNVTPVKYEYRFKRDGSDHFGEWKECTKDLYERYKTHYNGFLYEARALYVAPSGGDLALAWDQGYRSGVADERESEANIGICGGIYKIQPNRNNPYKM